MSTRFIRSFVIGAVFAAVLAAAGGALLRAQTPVPAPVNDPSGAVTGTASDVPVKDAKNPTLPEVMEVVGHNMIAINFVWTLFTGFLVMFMQAGFALVETGFTRAKNDAYTMMTNFIVYAIGMIGYWICGFALQLAVSARPSLGAAPV